MAKKDLLNNENADRSNSDDKNTLGKNKKDQVNKNEEKKGEYTHVKNANASGSGSIGRNDERLSYDKEDLGGF